MTLSNGRTSAYQWDYGLSVVTTDADGTIARIANEHGSKAFVVEAENGLYRIPDILLATGRSVVLYHVSGEEGTSLYTTSEDFLPVSEAPKPDDYIFTDEEIRTWKELDERLTDAEETIVQHTGEIADNTTAIAQNASAIATNTSNIAQNTGNIAQNTANIAQNATDINALESSVDSLGTDVNALETDVGSLETAVGALETGKISDPSTKATGQYLSWNGSAWVAADGGGGGGESELFVIQFDDVTSLPTCTGDDIRAAKSAGKTVIVEAFTHGAYVPYRIADTPGRALMLDFTTVEVFVEPVCARLSDESYTWSDQNRTWSRNVFSALVNADGYVKPDSGIPAADLSSAVQTSLGKADSALQAETDPTVPSWAKQSTKPSYTAAEVGALPDDTEIPTKVSDLTNDSGFITTETDPTVPSWAKASTKPAYTASEVGAVPTTRTINGLPLSSNIVLGIETLNNVSVISIGTNNTDGGTSLAGIKAVYSSTETVLGRYLGGSILFPLRKMVNEGESTDYALFEGIGGDGHLCMYKRTATKWEHTDLGLAAANHTHTAADVGAMALPYSPFTPDDGEILVYNTQRNNFEVVAPPYAYVVELDPYAGLPENDVDDLFTQIYQNGRPFVCTDGNSWWFGTDVTNVSFTVANIVGANATTMTFTYDDSEGEWTRSDNDWSFVPTSRTVNGKALSSNVSLTPSDVGAIANPSTKTTGQFLSWNGSAWVATSLPVWNGGVT